MGEMFLIPPKSLPSSLTNRFDDVSDYRRVEGRDMGEMTGGFKGGMKILKPLWIKDFWHFDGRDGYISQ